MTKIKIRKTQKANDIVTVATGPVLAPYVPPTPTFRIAPIGLDNTNTIPARAVVSNAFEPEDEFKNLYTGSANDIGAIQPPYDLRTLDRLCQENNTLSPCVEAMVTNVDGTGFRIMKDTADSEESTDDDDKATIKKIMAFFKQPWPGESFTTQRKNLRRDLERTGNAYLEIMRNLKDQIVFSKQVDAKMIRLVKYDDAVPYTVTLDRGGEEVTLKLMYRFRKFAQIVNGVQVRYFKEFGCPIDLNKFTGKWAPPNTRWNPKIRATEMFHFKCLPDAHTPYGVPRWISQLPSVLGSRKAEEFNMDFFDNGGIPPVLLLLQGGVLATESRKALEQNLYQQAQKKNRMIVVEMEPTGGSLDGNTPTSKVTVERFGAEKQNDSMFEKYDDKCEVRVRKGFRIPPIFLGQAADYSFATAFASYSTGEAQVFRPERDEFDEIINTKLLPEMGVTGYVMKSNPLRIDDATLKLHGIELALSTEQVDAAEALDEINKAVGTNIKVSTTLKPKQEVQLIAQANKNAGVPPRRNGGNGAPQSNNEKPGVKPTPRRSPTVTKADEDLAMQLMSAMRGRDLDAVKECFQKMGDMGEDDIEDVVSEVVDIEMSRRTAPPELKVV